MTHHAVRFLFVAAWLLWASSGGIAHGRESLTTLEAAARYADLAKEIELRLAGGERADTTLLGPLCLAYGKLKHYAKLFECIGRLEGRIRAGDTKIKADFVFASPADARPLPGMLNAEALLELGQHAQSTAAALAALSTLPADPGFDNSTWPPVKYQLSILPLLAISAAHSGARERALEYTKRLENTSIPFFGSALNKPVKSNSLARAYMAIGDYANALDNLGSSGLWRLVVGLADATSPMAYQGQGDTLSTQTELPRLLMLSKALAETGKRDDAKTSLDGLLNAPRLKDAGDLYWLALFERGRIGEAEAQLPQAAEFYRRAVEVIEQQRATINTEASKIGFVGDKQAVYARLIAVLVGQGRATEAFEYVERSKSRALVDMLASKRDFATQGLDPGKAKLVLAQLESVEFASKMQDETIKPGENSGVRNLQVLRQEIRATAPEFSSLVTVTSVPSEELRGLLGEGESLVEYYYQGKDLYVFVVSRERLQAVILDATGLTDQVRRFRNALESVGSQAWQTQAQALYARLWKPIEDMVTGKNVVVVAHGALHYLPFAALQNPEGSFLNDRYGLRFLPAASVLKFLRPAVAKKEAQLLALGNPDLGDPKLDLQFAESEATAVAGIFPDSRVLLRKDATETNFKKAGGVFSRIHIASHGKFQADDPLSSGLYLAKDADNDGVLTVGELYSMNLDADLVTLSACETGLGKIANGDDVVGLTRGFLYAGSRSIVSSLWSVDDKATAGLMKAFYENLGKLSKQEALRQAQIKSRQDFPHPFFWAAFQLTGRAE